MKSIGHYKGLTESNGFGFTSGIIGLDKNDKVVAGIYDQTLAAIRTLISILDTRGVGLRSVLKTTVYITNNTDYPEMNRAYKEMFGDVMPARSTVIVAGLPQVESDGSEKILFEIDAVVSLS